MRDAERPDAAGARAMEEREEVGMLGLLRADAARYRELGCWFLSLGFWIGAVYRYGHWARGLPRPFRYPLMALYWLAKLPGRFLLNVEIPAAARIGKGLCLMHPYNVFVPNDVEIGECCTIFHEVTIGSGPTPGSPRLGDHVVLFVGARVLGRITVGDRCEVGANCVLTRSLAAGMLAVPPAPLLVPAALVPSRAGARRGCAESEADPQRDPGTKQHA